MYTLMLGMQQFSFLSALSLVPKRIYFVQSICNIAQYRTAQDCILVFYIPSVAGAKNRFHLTVGVLHSGISHDDSLSVRVVH